MSILDRINPFREIREARRLIEVERNNAELLRESVAQLELQLEDEGWRQMAAGSEYEFSLSGLRKIMQLSRLMFLKNPLINRAVTLQSIYVWGQGVTISAEDDTMQATVDEFLNDPRNQAELTSHQARTMKEQDLQVLGNLFLALVDDMSTGAVVVRSIRPEEIEDIITDPEDAKSPWCFKRTWSQKKLNGQIESRTAYYPALGISEEARGQLLAQFGDKLLTTPVLHVRVGGLSDMRMGVPETYQAIDWARAYKGFLEDWASINRALAKFAWSINVPGGQKNVAAAKARLGTTVGSGSTLAETNPPSTTGATWVGSGVEPKPIKTAGATTSAEEGRRLLLMVSAATGMPETFFGDVSTGNLATAKSLDRPTELKFRDRQELWKSVLQTILGYVVERSSRAANGRMRQADGDPNTKAGIQVTFPPILEHDVNQQIAGIISAATLDGKTLAGTLPLEDVTRMVAAALGVQDVEALVAAVLAADEEKQARADELAARMQGQPQPAGADPGGGAPPDPVAEAARSLREALVTFVEHAKERRSAA